MIKKEKGITLITLIVTIIVMLILAGVAIILTVGNNGIFSKTQYSVEIHNKEEATQTIKMKIAGIQMKNYVETQELPNLQELADNLCQDEEIEYVNLERQKTASLNKIIVGENTSIFTKIKKYPYEFEINDSLELASVDGVKVATNNDDLIEKMQNLEEKYKNLEEKLENMKQKEIKSGTATIPTNSSGKQVDVAVKFETPLENTNYAVVITSIGQTAYWAQNSYAIKNKTINGFTIISYCLDGSKPQHSADWVVVPY